MPTRSAPSSRSRGRVSDPLEGVILHEPREESRVEKAASQTIVTAKGSTVFDTTTSLMAV